MNNIKANVIELAGDVLLQTEDKQEESQRYLDDKTCFMQAQSIKHRGI